MSLEYEPQLRFNNKADSPASPGLGAAAVTNSYL